MKRGTMIYVPSIVIDELGFIMKDYNLPKKSAAFKKFAKLARVGRETDKLFRIRLD